MPKLTEELFMFCIIVIMPILFGLGVLIYKLAVLFHG